MIIDEILEDILETENKKISPDELELSESYNDFEETGGMSIRDIMPGKISKLVRLNKALNSFGVGYVDRETRTLKTDGNLEENYHYLSPEEFASVKGGISLDYAEYQYRVFAKSGYETVNLYLEINGKLSTAITIVKIKDRYFYPESSNKKHLGVCYSNHIADLINFALNNMVSDQHLTHTYPFEVRAYKGYENYGCNLTTFRNDMKQMKPIMKGNLGNQSLTVQSGFGMMTEGVIEEFDESAEDTSSDMAFLEGTIPHTFELKGVVEKKIFAVLGTPEGRRKYKRIQDEYLNRNMEKLSTPGPMYLIVFGDSDQKAYFDLFQIQKEDIVAAMKNITQATGSNSDFKFLRQNPILVVLYFCIRYFTLENDEQGVNSSLAIFALGIYWSKFTKFFPKGVIGPVMDYTIDNMTEKFMVKKCGSIFNTLVTSIKQSYQFHKKRFYEGGDDDVVAFLQRISNDQNSLMKKIANEYMNNWREGKAVTTRNDDYDPDNPIVDDVQNASTIIQNQVSKVTLPIISNGVDLVLAEAAARMSKISISDCREYLIKIMVKENLPTLERFVEAILFMFIYTEGKSVRDIKSQYFLTWAVALFRKTNSKDENLRTINAILEKWAEESGIYARYKREGSRINYKKGIFFYVVLSIQKYS